MIEKNNNLTPDPAWVKLNDGWLIIWIAIDYWMHESAWSDNFWVWRIIDGWCSNICPVEKSPSFVQDFFAFETQKPSKPPPPSQPHGVGGWVWTPIPRVLRKTSMCGFLIETHRCLVYAVCLAFWSVAGTLDLPRWDSNGRDTNSRNLPQNTSVQSIHHFKTFKKFASKNPPQVDLVHDIQLPFGGLLFLLFALVAYSTFR